MINIEIHKNIIQSSNLNFLIGSGFSRPFLPTLGGIEKNISEIEIREDIPVKEKRYIKDSLLNKYFIDVMYPNVEILCGSTNAMCLTTFENYIHFLDVTNSIIQRRGSTIIKKQINIFRRFWHRTRTGVSVRRSIRTLHRNIMKESIWFHRLWRIMQK